MAAANIRLKVLLGVAVTVGVYIVATSGSADETAGVVAASPAKVRAAQPSDEEQLLARPAGRNVSSTQGTMSANSAGQQLVRLEQRVAPDGDSDALFQKHSWYVAPPPPPTPPQPVEVVNTSPPAPTAPPMPFGVMGSYVRPGDAKVYFLTRGDRVFDVRVGDTIDGTYSVESEADGQLLLTYKPLNIQQSIALGASR
jgi:hypothetical protein